MKWWWRRKKKVTVLVRLHDGRHFAVENVHYKVRKHPRHARSE